MSFHHILLVLTLFPLKIHGNPHSSILYISFLEEPIINSTSRSRKSHISIFFDSHLITFKFFHSVCFPFLLPCPSLANFPTVSPDCEILIFCFCVYSKKFKTQSNIDYRIEFFSNPNFPFLNPFISFLIISKKKIVFMVVTHVGENK